MSDPVLTDLEIAREAVLLPITEVAQRCGVDEDALEPFGRYKAKIDPALLTAGEPAGRVVLVTAMSPTPAGEGKSTLTVGLADSLARAGHRVMVALREPSLGPVLGMKGGATGGGLSQVVPMEDINLHFTGDFHAITSANNALMALVDNHIHQGNALQIDPRRMTFKRVLDMNDRALREIVIGLGGPTQGVPRQDGFQITVASEIMAVFCLSRDLSDLRDRLGRMVFGATSAGEPLTVAHLGAQGVLTVLLKEALKPNLVQTLAGTPALIHGGPFANIAHGCNSLIATQTARRLADVVVTEAGFGADLGAEKYMNITSRVSGTGPGSVAPAAAVVVATVRALKMHGGVARDHLDVPDVEAMAAGAANLRRHLHNIGTFGVPAVVAINRFGSDTAEELDWLLAWCAAEGVPAAVADVWADGGGGAGGDQLAELVADALDKPSTFGFLYGLELPVADKIRTIATEIYGAGDVEFSAKALKQLADSERHGWSALPVCIAKTQYSFSDDATRLGAPRGFTLHVRELLPRMGAGFVVVLTGAVMTMPGLPADPAALRMDVDGGGQVTGLF
ncbi:formate--tetrahydrofolate ligase [Pseudarthrobacter sp. PS3-L1]|uniref:formate--tetrahydrofolate ligase n=1 Tax=Pseudarthrobacter sp. PS3-L1 TaxID=3046207 RepID=UPI0024BAD8E0|nr:formate--tetrahydrofolate ligase [Pseudarthrobacter sp. PS3-L1]MDJ0321325.1 formate--tetrahydrofolate ligase [Pseudarthrobacter sp. PS3-L1]